MTTYTITESATIPAPPDRVYRVFADYQEHARILPNQFRNLVVEKGGVGAGTEITFDIHAFGKTQKARGKVTEPEPGRVLVETYPEIETVTTFIVDPAAGGARVTFKTEMPQKPGVLGKIERFMMRRFLTSVYRDELQRVAAYVKR